MTKSFLLKEHELAELFAFLPKEGILLLRGDLASGKTTLVRQYCTFLGVNKEQISSPSFSLMHEYICQNGSKIYHYDLYHKGFGGLFCAGLLDELESPGLHLIEWPDDELLGFLEANNLAYMQVELFLEDEARSYCVS